MDKSLASKTIAENLASERSLLVKGLTLGKGQDACR